MKAPARTRVASARSVRAAPPHFARTSTVSAVDGCNTNVAGGLATIVTGWPTPYVLFPQDPDGLDGDGNNSPGTTTAISCDFELLLLVLALATLG